MNIKSNSDNTYLVENVTLTPHSDHIECECRTYRELSMFLMTKKVVCPHIQILLKHLNCNTLNDYIERTEDEMIEKMWSEKLQEEMNYHDSWADYI